MIRAAFIAVIAIVLFGGLATVAELAYVCRRAEGGTGC